MRPGAHFTSEQLARVTASHQGRVQTAETRAKIATAHMGKPRPLSVHEALLQANLGRPLSAEHRAALSVAGKGKLKSEEHRAKIAAANVGKHDYRGSLNPHWQGGVTPEHLAIRASEDYDIWRSSVFARDGYACQKCGDDAGHNLRAHHMDCFSDFPEKRMDVNNGVTLCASCHVEFHHRYGVWHNRKWQTDEFLSGAGNEG